MTDTSVGDRTGHRAPQYGSMFAEHCADQGPPVPTLSIDASQVCHHGSLWSGGRVDTATLSLWPFGGCLSPPQVSDEAQQ